MNTQYSLYYKPTCPYCIKVLMQMKLMHIADMIELRNKSKNKEFEDELIAATGKAMVPCLRIDRDEQSEWMHESDEIIKFLKKEF